MKHTSGIDISTASLLNDLSHLSLVKKPPIVLSSIRLAQNVYCLMTGEWPV